MARILITGSADGLGQLAAQQLVSQGHEVVLHARNKDRALDAMEKTKGAAAVLVADLANIEETKKLAEQVNALGRFDAVIHNAGVYQRSPKEIFTVNTLAPYILTCLIQKPSRLIYLSSGMHLQGRANIDRFASGNVSYSDSKLHVVMLAMAVASAWTDVCSNAVDPGWVPTKMGGQGAPDDLTKGYETQTWLAVSTDEKANVSGKYFYHKKEKRCNPEAENTEWREKFLLACEKISGVSFQSH